MHLISLNSEKVKKKTFPTRTDVIFIDEDAFVST